MRRDRGPIVPHCFGSEAFFARSGPGLNQQAELAASKPKRGAHKRLRHIAADARKAERAARGCSRGALILASGFGYGYKLYARSMNTAIAARVTGFSGQ